jgi:hypothetical protein
VAEYDISDRLHRGEDKKRFRQIVPKIHHNDYISLYDRPCAPRFPIRGGRARHISVDTADNGVTIILFRVE